MMGCSATFAVFFVSFEEFSEDFEAFFDEFPVDFETFVWAKEVLPTKINMVSTNIIFICRLKSITITIV